MCTIQAPIAKDNGLIGTEGYGYGLYIGTVPGVGRVIFHTGDNIGFLAINGWFRDEDVRFAVLSNEETADMQALVRHVIMAAFPRLD